MKLIAAAALGFSFLLTSCGGAGQAKNADAGAVTDSGAVPVVPVAKVARENLSNDLVLSAEFVPYQEIDVMSKVAGYIKTIRAYYWRPGPRGRCWPPHSKFLKCRMS